MHLSARHFYAVAFSTLALHVSAQTAAPTAQCDADGAFGVSFQAPPPTSRGTKESILSGARVLFAVQPPVPEPYFELAFGVSPKSRRVWMIEAKLPLQEGETWQQVSAALQQSLSKSAGVAFRPFSGSPTVYSLGKGEHVDVAITAGSSYLLVTCFHLENTRLNTQEGLAAISGR